MLCTTPLALCAAGMRGIEYEFYPNLTTSYMSRLASLNSTITVESSNGSRAILPGSWETPMEHMDVPYHCSRYKAFFKAPLASDYVFYLSADDFAQLNGTWTLVRALPGIWGMDVSRTYHIFLSLEPACAG